MSGKRLQSYDELKATRDVRKAVKLVQKSKPARQPKREAENREGYEPEYLDWIRKQPCIITGRTTGRWWVLSHGQEVRVEVKVEAAHMKAGRTKGTDMTALPVESQYHTRGPESQHEMGIKSWARHHHLDIPLLIAQHRKAYALECAAKVKAVS